MVEVKFKNKDANHSVLINGKFIKFKEGKAEVSEVDAEAIKNLKDPAYDVMESKKPIEEPVKKIKKRNKAKKS